MSMDYIIIYHSNPDNCELITIIITLNYGQQKIPFIIIFADAYHLRKYFKNNINNDILFAQSSTSFFND